MTSKNSNSQKQESNNNSDNLCDRVSELNECGAMQSMINKYVNPIRVRLNDTVQRLNSIPTTLREQVLLASKMTAVHIQAIGDVLSSTADPKQPPLTKERYQIANFLLNKHPNLAQKLITLEESIKNLPPEKRGLEIVVFNKKHMQDI